MTAYIKAHPVLKTYYYSTLQHIDRNYSFLSETYKQCPTRFTAKYEQYIPSKDFISIFRNQYGQLLIRKYKPITQYNFTNKAQCA